MKRRLLNLLTALSLLLCAGLACPAAVAAAGEPQRLQAELQRITGGLDGRVGVCVRGPAGAAGVNTADRFSLQSVMKIIVAAAVLDSVDRGERRLDDRVVVRRDDLSVFVQPLAKLVGDGGFETTVSDLVRRAVVDSDSAATDVLIAHLGGPPGVQDFLRRKGIGGVRVDRDERHLQTEIAGLSWKPQYVDPEALRRAMDAVPERERDEAYRRYQADERDTATPQGMAALLDALAGARLLSPASTEHLLRVMEQTVTFPDRLKAGVAAGWRLGHKTGTSGSWRGVTAATNDAGVLTSPHGRRISVVVFIGDSRASAAERAGLMAHVARAVIEHYP